MAKLRKHARKGAQAERDARIMRLRIMGASALQVCEAFAKDDPTVALTPQDIYRATRRALRRIGKPERQQMIAEMTERFAMYRYRLFAGLVHLEQHRPERYYDALADYVGKLLAVDDRQARLFGLDQAEPTRNISAVFAFDIAAARQKLDAYVGGAAANGPAAVAVPQLTKRDDG